MLNLVPTAIIEIGAHTDNTGREETNLKLSQKRAEIVVNYLIKKGIDGNRLIARGYGETIPLEPNQLPDGSDNPEGRMKNRRTHIKIIGNLSPNEDFEE
jgi:outer membrane protein OmpA-like peptidoglycan-associated protein